MLRIRIRLCCFYYIISISSLLLSVVALPSLSSYPPRKLGFIIAFIYLYTQYTYFAFYRVSI